MATNPAAMFYERFATHGVPSGQDLDMLMPSSNPDMIQG